MLQVFQSVSDHFGTLFIKGLTEILHSPHMLYIYGIKFANIKKVEIRNTIEKSDKSREKMKKIC